MQGYDVSIGLETHVQLKTRSKLFCSCPTRFGEEPNTNVCPVCLGYPGTLPVVNYQAVRLTVVTGLMLGCRVNLHSKFDRKNYFYPDMPKNYQISQYDQPICTGGSVEIEVEGKVKRIRLRRIHLEEDVGKSFHFGRSSGVDFNRAGIPLMEIVTEPDISSADEAHAYLVALKAILEYGEVSDCNLEEGNVRCDVNCSVRKRDGSRELGTKTEIKNLNTFRGVYRALKYEIARQIRVLERGGTIQQQTLRWDDEKGVTVALRSKEYAHDYRYFPDPDIPPVVLRPEEVEAWRESLPELPSRRKRRFQEQYGLPEYDAGVLVAEREVADFFERTVAEGATPKAASNWVMTEVLRVIGESGKRVSDLRLRPEGLARLISLVERGMVNMPTAKEVFGVMLETGGDPERIVRERGLAQVSDEGELMEVVGRVLAANQKVVADYRAGKKAALQFLIGQVMRETRGKANPKAAARILREQLEG